MAIALLVLIGFGVSTAKANPSSIEAVTQTFNMRAGSGNSSGAANLVAVAPSDVADKARDEQGQGNSPEITDEKIEEALQWGLYSLIISLLALLMKPAA